LDFFYNFFLLQFILALLEKSRENQQNTIKQPLQLTNTNPQLEISMNVDHFKELFDCGIISQLNGKINLA